MRVKKIPMDGYTAYLYKTDKYTTIHLNFLFEMDYTRENIYKCDLLEEYMLNTNAVYKTKREISEKIRACYSMGHKMTNYNVGKKMFVEVAFTFFDEKLIDDNYLNNALEFAYDMLYKPNFENGKLDQETLKLCKSNMIGNMASTVVEPKYKARTGYLETVFPNSYITEDIIKTKEEYEKLLNSFNDQDLIDMYYKIMDESFVGLTIMGNVDNAFLDRVKTMFKFKKIKEIDKKYDGKLQINNEKEFIKVSDPDVHESIVYAVYNIKNYTRKKRYIYESISNLMNSYGKVIYKVLRDDLKIVYSAGSSFNHRAEFYVMQALIDKDNLNKCLDGFNFVIEKLMDKEYVESILPILKRQINIADYVADENKWNMVDDLFIYAFKTAISRRKFNNIINKITAEDIVEEVKNLERKVVYFYEGLKNEEE